MKSEALKLLYAGLPKTSDSRPDATETETAPSLPDFAAMVRCVADKASSRVKSRSAVTYGAKVLPFDVAAYAEVLRQIESSQFFLFNNFSNFSSLFFNLFFNFIFYFTLFFNLFN